MRLLTLSGLFAILSCAAFKPDDAPKYCNDRFGFCIPYPPGFSAPVESDNADGAVMRSTDGTVEVRAWGHFLAPEVGETMTTIYTDQTSGIRIVHAEQDSTGFTFTGLDSASGLMVYQKTVQHPADDSSTLQVVQTISISYPAEQAEDYTAYCSAACRSLQ